MMICNNTSFYLFIQHVDIDILGTLVFKAGFVRVNVLSHLVLTHKYVIQDQSSFLCNLKASCVLFSVRGADGQLSATQ